MNYVEYISSFQQFVRLGLERMERMAFHLGNLQDNLNIIHIAGTNGKGSVCAVLEAVLTSAGYKVGKYISPELDKVNERISIGGVDISDIELEKLMNEIQPIVNMVEVEFGEMPSRFEVSTIAAFKYFNDKKCDYVLLETGLGGRLDATNICKKPLVTVITTIDIDHAEYLGDTIEKIALEKAGIIKHGVPCVSAIQPIDAENVLKTVCAENGCLLNFVDNNKIKSNNFEEMNEIFDYKMRKGLKCGLAGQHQIINATVVLDVIDILIEKYNAIISEDAIFKGIATAQNRARLETLKKEPYIIFDGAHNLSGAKALAQSLERYFCDEKFTIVIAMMQDKDCVGMISELGKIAKGFIATQVPENPRALSAEDLCKNIENLGFNVVREKDLNKAITMVNGNTVICGSLYYYKYVRAIVKE